MTLHASPTEIATVGEIERKLAEAAWSINDLALFSAHPLGTCLMGADPARSVVDSHCQTHDVRGLFVIDGSVVRMSLGVNPQLTIMAEAEKSADWLAEHFNEVRS